jgi:radical SAM superfamily enzyme YgiQ (UPF0313 family)
MKVLLINPNRYKSPPVPPIGLEYLAASLQGKGHHVEVTDLCFSDNPLGELDAVCSAFCPDVAGITVRNVDSVLFHTNEFFLDEIKSVIDHIKSRHGLRVVIGGTGVNTSPQEVTEYLNADFAIAGPAEQTLNELLHGLRHDGDVPRIWSGTLHSDTVCTRNISGIDYRRYYQEGGLAGFETHKGCSSSCAYCIEANSRVSFRDVGHVVREIGAFVEAGYEHFHLCDSEFNESLLYAVDFCTALISSGIKIRWAAYMRPSEFSRKLLKLMKESGVYLVTLTVDTMQKCTEYWTNIEKFVFTAKPLGLKVAIDLLTGFPYETEESIREHLYFLRRLLPDRISVNTYIRLYKTLPITRLIEKDSGLKTHLLGNIQDSSYVQPVFYNHIDTEKLEELIGGDPLFRIEGPEKGVNYTRV